MANFIEKVFQDYSAFSKYMRKKMGMKIVNKFRIYRENKIKRQNNELAINQLFGGMDDSSPAKKVSPKTKQKQLPRKTKIVKSPEERMASLLPDPKSNMMPV